MLLSLSLTYFMLIYSSFVCNFLIAFTCLSIDTIVFPSLRYTYLTILLYCHHNFLCNLWRPYTTLTSITNLSHIFLAFTKVLPQSDDFVKNFAQFKNVLTWLWSRTLIYEALNPLYALYELLSLLLHPEQEIWETSMVDATGTLKNPNENNIMIIQSKEFKLLVTYI